MRDQRSELTDARSGMGDKTCGFVEKLTDVHRAVMGVAKVLEMVGVKGPD
jgi:hypothetical protein